MKRRKENILNFSVSERLLRMIRRKLKPVIENLDVKKKVELERTWKKVNKDFGSIFSTLLPGSNAKLEAPDGMEVWEGLEVKVAFGDIWKQSLSEAEWRTTIVDCIIIDSISIAVQTGTNVHFG